MRKENKSNYLTYREYLASCGMNHWSFISRTLIAAACDNQILSSVLGWLLQTKAQTSSLTVWML